MNHTLIRSQKARSTRQAEQRLIVIWSRLALVIQRRALIRLLVAMTYRTRGKFSRWLYLTRWIWTYKHAWNIWRGFLKKWADQAEAERQAVKNAAERIRLDKLATFDAQQQARRTNGATPSQLRRAERRFVQGVSA